MQPDDAALELQVQLEENMLARGIARARAWREASEATGQACASPAGSRLIKNAVLAVADEVKRRRAKGGAGVRGKFMRQLRPVNTDTAAFVALSTALSSIMAKKYPLTGILHRIGKALQNEIMYAELAAALPEYVEEMERDSTRRNRTYDKRLQVARKAAARYAIEYPQWTVEECVGVGGLLMDCILRTTDMFYIQAVKQPGPKQKPKGTLCLYLTPQTQQWIHKHNAYIEALRPATEPCIIPPRDWIGLHDGGYHSPELSSVCGLVHTTGSQGAETEAQLEYADMTQVYSAVNALQRTPWRINKRVLAVVNEVWASGGAVGMPTRTPIEMPGPPYDTFIKKEERTPEQQKVYVEYSSNLSRLHAAERARVSNVLSAAATINIANRYAQYSKFYYVYFLDFRGRMYCYTPTLSPQGSDLPKGLLEFGSGLPLGERGMYWLKVHGANRYGVDKVSFDDRIRWVQDNHDAIMQAAKDPLMYTGFWGAADEPYQFLAFCFEYADMQEQGAAYVSHLPIGMDGSCNGLQNFSAMLRDARGAAATNVSPSDKPQDIYAEVGRAATEAVRRDESEGALLWRDYINARSGVIPRGMVKRPVMTLPYGLSKYSCGDYILQYLIEEDPPEIPRKLRHVASNYLRDIVWDSIGTVVVAARQAMDFIQACAAVAAKQGVPLVWTNPVGFRVYQGRRVHKITQIEANLMGTKRKLALSKETDVLHVAQQKLGAAPNFVHSMDSANLVQTINMAQNEYSIRHFCAIHDDFGTHACNTDALHKAIRYAFVENYAGHDVLQEFRDGLELAGVHGLPPVPAYGTLNLTQVINSDYFFS